MATPLQRIPALKKDSPTEKVEAAVEVVRESAVPGFNGSVEIHYKDGVPVHWWRHDKGKL